jgi:hypothetical protein
MFLGDLQVTWTQIGIRDQEPKRRCKTGKSGKRVLDFASSREFGPKIHDPLLRMWGYAPQLLPSKKKREVNPKTASKRGKKKEKKKKRNEKRNEKTKRKKEKNEEIVSYFFYFVHGLNR